jgi:hypothetical protein
MRALTLVLLLAPLSAHAKPARPRADVRVVANELRLAEATAALERSEPGRALEALARIDRSAPLFRAALLEGRAQAALGVMRDAARALERARRIALEGGRALDDASEVLLAKAAHAAGDCGLALEACARATDAVERDDDAAYAWVDCIARRGDDDEALAVLDRIGLSPRTHALRARLLVRAGAYEMARADALAAAAELTADELVALFRALASAPLLAALVAQVGMARFPDDARFAAVQGDAERAALLDTAALATATEALRSRGVLRRALTYNGRVDDDARRLRQRLAILVDMRAWDRALALRARAASFGLLADDPVAYALAYAAFQTGADDDASALLDSIEDPAWFERATSLRAAIAACAGKRSDRCFR